MNKANVLSFSHYWLFLSSIYICCYIFELKKNEHPSCPSNYYFLSSFFFAKIPRKIFLWLLQFFSFNFLLIPLHSDVGLHHCTETAHVKVNTDFHNAKSNGCFWIRWLLSPDMLSSVGLQSNITFLLNCWLILLHLCCSFLPISSNF